jgi:histidinol-phosphatase (PHP family)
MIDLHVHTWRCRHAEGTPNEYVRAAAAAGVRTIAFTEHLPLAPELAATVPGAEGYAMPREEFDEYLGDVAAAAELGETIGVEVLSGIEIDAVPHALGHARELCAEHRFDMVLGSVHFIDGWAFDDPSRRDGYAEWDTGALWERYFSEVVRAARTADVDVMAHVDLVKKFGVWPTGPTGDMYSSLASDLADAGVAVEVNTAGLRKPCAEIYPGSELLTELRRAGVPATIGSDAHRPAEVGAGAAEAVAALKDAGYRSVVVFRDRRPVEVGIDEL